MTVVVFCGPTIAADIVGRSLEAVVRPPAQRGDVLRAALDRPDAIGLIDGYFDRVPSVWHKEILWAMAQGIHVFGSSSMGALRAAELAPFGMVGVGAVFEAFRRGELEDDDEVAVAHGDAESGYRPASDAMVNIRWTLRAAEEQGVVRPSTRAALEARAKAEPYHCRDLRSLVGPSAGDLLPSEVGALRRWIAHGRVDQKKADAVALLQVLAAFEREGWHPKTVDFEFVETDGWDALRARVERERASAGHPWLADVADELRSRGLFGRTTRGATTRLLALDRLKRSGAELNARAVEWWIEVFRRQGGLLTEASFDAWVAESGLEGDELVDFFRREAVIQATRAELEGAWDTAIEDELRANVEQRLVS